ncbi:MAG: UMP kinase [Candidatus Micrarchaeota archaeon]|nr:UMP kinase [Candidatus Micrarchaeota archaeon]
MERVVFSLGGSVFYNNGINFEFVEPFIQYLKRLDRKGAVVIGGGQVAREFIEAGRRLGLNEYECDLIAIQETRKNATLFLYAIRSEDVYPRVLKSAEEAGVAINHYRWLVSGGFFPGITTDAVATMVAEAIGAPKVINISRVDGLYDKDPKRFKDAKKIKRAPIKEFLKIAVEGDQRKAGENFVFDIIALKIAQRSRIQLEFVPPNIEEIDKAVKGEPHIGTTLYP